MLPFVCKKATNKNIFVANKIRNILKTNQTTQNSFLNETRCSAEEARHRTPVSGEGDKGGASFSVSFYVALKYINILTGQKKKKIYCKHFCLSRTC